jgi:hypothetical protein
MLRRSQNLHADSWRRHYRGAYADAFLDGDVLADRRIHTPVLFNMEGDVPTGTWSSPTGWSRDAHGGG